MQGPLNQVMSSGPEHPGFSWRAGVAVWELRAFFIRFHRLVARARDELNAEMETDEPREDRLTGRLLTVGVEAARERAVPAAVAAGAATAVVTGPLRGLTGAAAAGTSVGGAVLGEVFNEFFKTGLEAVSVAGLAEIAAKSPPPRDQMNEVQEICGFLLDDVNELISCIPGSSARTWRSTRRRLRVFELICPPPSRMIVGEVRQQEALDLLIALNSGLPGMGTIHAKSAREAITKMCTLPLLAGENIGSRFVVPTVASSIDLVVHISADVVIRLYVRQVP
jgi:hypothetical protein